jgi:hypothetical protein
MQTITEIFRTHGPEYIERYGDNMPHGHHKAIQAIIQCRTQVYGMAAVSQFVNNDTFFIHNCDM